MQALRRRLIRVYTVFYPILFFWLYYCNVKLNYSIFRCPKFRNFIVMFMKVCFVYTVNEHQVITDEE